MSGISNTAAETKQLDARWEEKVDLYCIPIHIYDTLDNINRIILDCNNALSEAGMSRISYSSQANEIEKIVDAIGCMNRYVSEIPTELNERIDAILYEGFNKRATETISRIHMDDFKTKNTLGLHGSWSAAGGGQIYEGTRLREDICFADFLGNNVGKETELGYNANNPIDCVQEFADLFKADYETLKSAGSLNGSEIKNLDDYLDNIEKMGEFDHKMDQPFKSFVSQLLDITIIIPFIECATGYDLITGEDLTSFELTMKGVFAVVDFLTLGTAVLATKPFEVGGMAAVKLAGKTIVTTMASDATAYTVGYLSNQAGAPLAITMLLSMGSGIAVTKVAGKYFFKNAAGDLLGECNVPEESVEGLKEIGQVNKDGLKSIQTNDLKIIETRTPDVANKEWLARGYDKSPYDPNFEVKTVQAGSESYVRVFSYNADGTSNKLGGWIMKKGDIEGLTPSQIADKYALPKEPTHICDVTVKPEYELQTGIANKVDEWGQGGGQQFDTMGRRLPQSSFINERRIGE